ncbi:hypothetical protein COU79_03350 [Candidatus Peregrinibacteria bacterium CG10_big_fil_rev_8_21_14_0_10_54_7]|nr:MAG: hypothetical protein COU79_03350 [Candidatus Peregrinibacteria bacterium CG10_big_fil_rev_8_21_14_0_10_54_7]
MEEHELIVQLRAANGRILFPRYRFAAGNGELILDERRFTPGLYTLILTKRYLKSGREEAADQEFAWGVLALNTDQDRYKPGQTAHIAIGVLDDLGAIVCDADLTLTITNPNGVVTTVSTDDGGIRVTGTCGVKEAGFINPDFEAFLTMNVEGTYHLELLASNFLGNSHKLTSDVQVTAEPPFIVHRTAATRLWPFAPSPMTIEVEFFEDFTGVIIDTVPDAFGITDSSPHAETALVPATHELTLTWSGSWTAGETATFWYEYDAPDVSPEFYLVGPLALSSPSPLSIGEGGASGASGGRGELRQWQIANDNEGQSTNYRIPNDVQAAGGGELALSDNYKLSDTIGETVIGLARSALYALQSGYRHTDDSYIALGCGDSVDLGTLAGGEGQLTGNIDCTVVADGAGYSLSWHGGAPDYGLVGYWKLDETSGTLAYDLSGNGYNASHQGTPTISTTVPSTHFSTRSLSFNSSTTDYLDIGTSFTDSIENAGTISVWAKRSGAVGGALFNRSTGTGWADERLNIYMRSDTNVLGWSISNGTSYLTQSENIDTVFPTGTWKHFVMSWDGSSVKFFVDGVQDNTLSTSQTYVPEISGVSARIGWSQGLANQYYNGLVDEVRVYNRALSTGEILQLASVGPPASMVSADLYTIPPMEFPSTGGLLGHWKFDEIAGTVAADSSGNGNNGTHTSTPTISTSVPTDTNIANIRSLSFDGTSGEYVKVADASSGPLSTIGTGDFTVSLWASNTDATSSYRQLISNWSTTGIHFLKTNTSRYLGAYVGDNVEVRSSYSIPTDGSWHYYVLARESGAISFYVDGSSSAVSTGNGTGHNNSVGAAVETRIGSRGDSVNQLWQGGVDDVRIYNRALSAAEIKALAAVPQTWSIPTTSAYWGGRLSSTSTDTDAKWGTDSSTDTWLAVGDGGYTVVSRTGRTTAGGSTETFQFRAEVGSDKIQAPGTYLGTVTVTAAAL